MGGDSPAVSNLKKANSSLLAGIGQAQAYAKEGSGQQVAILNNAYLQANDALNTHVNAALQAGEQWAQVGLKAYQDLNQGYSDPNAALSTFLDSADYKLFYGGENGQGGDANKSALDRFKESPDYQFRLNQTLDAMNRRASSGGYSNDPRMAQELMAQGGEMASQEYGNYATRLGAVYNQYNTNKQQAATLGFNAMQGNQQLRLGLAQGLSQNYSNWGAAQTAVSSNYYDSMANAELAKGQANAQYRLTRAAMSAPGSSAAIMSGSQQGQGWGS